MIVTSHRRGSFLPQQHGAGMSLAVPILESICGDRVASLELPEGAVPGRVASELLRVFGLRPNPLNPAHATTLLSRVRGSRAVDYDLDRTLTGRLTGRFGVLRAARPSRRGGYWAARFWIADRHRLRASRRTSVLASALH